MKPLSRAFALLCLLASNIFVESSMRSGLIEEDNIENVALNSPDLLSVLDMEYTKSVGATPGSAGPMGSDVISNQTVPIKKKRNLEQFLAFPEDNNDDGLPRVEKKSLQEVAQIMLSLRHNLLRAYLKALGPEVRNPIDEIISSRDLLHIAVDADDCDVAEILLNEYKFDPNKFDPYFGSAIYLVKSKAMINLLLSAGANIFDQRRCHLYSSAIESAKSRGQLHLVTIFEPLSTRKNNLQNDLIKTGSANKPELKFSASRDNMYRHAVAKLRSRVANSSPNLSVNFMDEQGQDAGGLTVEFVTLMKDALLKKGTILEYHAAGGYYNLKEDSQHAEFKSSKLTDEPDVADELKLLGYIVGLSIYHQIPLNITFSPIVNHIICGLNPHSEINLLSVVKELDPSEYISLFKAVELKDDQLIDFEYPVDEYDQFRIWKKQRGELKERADVREYIEIKANFMSYKPYQTSLNYFKSGLELVIDPSIIGKHLDSSDVQKVLAGVTDYSASEWRTACEVDGPPRLSEDLQIQYNWFWKAVDEIGPENRLNLLKFVTALQSLPIGGFAALAQRPIISFLDFDNPKKTDYLPLAATCFNQIKLYKVSSYDRMLNNLIAVAKYGHSGFALK